MNGDITIDTPVSIGYSFDAAKHVSQLLLSKDGSENDLARRIVIQILDNWANIPDETAALWSDLVEACGFYPYLAKDESFLKLQSLSGAIRKESYKSKYLHGKYFHEEQQAALEVFNSGKNLIISAPTSFGKSLLIEELVASKKFKDIIVVQPTLALLDETRKSLKNYKSDYKLVLKTSQSPSIEKGNIFLFTAERVVEYGAFPDIDLLVIDEFYKLSQTRKDERADVLNIAFYRILKHHNPRFYMLGPNIDGISAGFAEKYNAHFYKTKYSLVNAESINLFELYKDRLTDPDLKEELLFKTLDEHTVEQTIIYCSSPERARKLATKYLKHVEEGGVTSEDEIKNLAVIDWLRKHIHPDWSLIKCLEAGIGVHDGALPRHVSASIIHAFNRSEIKYLFCTSTIIEGVNTSAKNIVIFDKRRGRSNIDFFDHSNISGRAGRMMVHYTGRIFNFNSIPQQKSVIIDIPFFEQNKNTSSEILVQLQLEDIQNPIDENYVKTQQVPVTERELFKKNAVAFWGQKNLLDKLRSEMNVNPSSILWSGYPDYNQLLYILDLARTYLAKSGERQYSAAKLATLTNIYAQSKNIMVLVGKEMEYQRNQGSKKSKVELVDDAVRVAFQFQRHWLSYIIPKWLYVVDSLQQFVCAEKGINPGSYAFYAGYIENDFLESQFSFLAEVGVPRSAIEKMMPYLTGADKEDEIIALINEDMLTKADLSEYERQKVLEAL